MNISPSMPSIAPEIQHIALIALFDSKGRLLLLKRGEEQHCGKLWSLPGGKIESDEQALQAAKRELKEETGLVAIGWQCLGESSFAYPDRLLHFSIFTCVCDNATMLQAETQHRWVNTDALEHYPMPEANTEIMAMILAAK